jgi:hypothetical protein
VTCARFHALAAARSIAGAVSESAVLDIAVEVQLNVDEQKRFAWPVYVIGLRARMHRDGQGGPRTGGAGKAAVVLNLLQLKFRKLNAKIKQRIETASAEELDLYAMRILKAKTLDDVFKKR